MTSQSTAQSAVSQSAVSQSTAPYVVFVDLDNTLLVVSSAFLIVKRLWQTRVIGFGVVAGALFGAIGCLLGLTTPERFFSRQARRLKGVTTASLTDFHTGWYQLAQRYLRASLLAELEHHRSAHATIVLLSAAPRHTCEPFVQGLRLHGAISSELEMEAGRCTGRFAGRYCHGRQKLVSARRYLEDHQLSLRGSFFYADSWAADGPMLDQVEHPVCVSPSRRLRQVAERRRWRVMEA